MVKARKKSAVKSAGHEAKIIIHQWVEDASLEVFSSPQVYPQGKREVEFTAKVFTAPLQQPDLCKINLCLRANITYEKSSLSMAEVRYAAVTKKQLLEKDGSRVVNAIYPQARLSLEAILRLTGQPPPLPEKIST